MEAGTQAADPGHYGQRSWTTQGGERSSRPRALAARLAFSGGARRKQLFGGKEQAREPLARVGRPWNESISVDHDDGYAERSQQPDTPVAHAIGPRCVTSPGHVPAFRCGA
jgi:hypothetical protein